MPVEVLNRGKGAVGQVPDAAVDLIQRGFQLMSLISGYFSLW